MHDVDDYAEASPWPDTCLWVRLPAVLRQCPGFTRRAMAAIDPSPTPTRWFLLNAEANMAVDLTAADTLGALRHRSETGIVFAMARVKQDLRDDLGRAGLMTARARRGSSGRSQQ